MKDCREMKGWTVREHGDDSVQRARYVKKSMGYKAERYTAAKGKEPAGDCHLNMVVALKLKKLRSFSMVSDQHSRCKKHPNL